MAAGTRHSLVIALLIGFAPAVLAAQDGGMAAVDRARIDTTCAPCKDFYRFANGRWLDTVTVPPDETTWGPLAELHRRNRDVVRRMLDSLGYAPQRHSRNAAERKVGTFYRACMDSSANGSNPLRALDPELRRIAAIRTPADLGGAIGRLWRYRVRAVIGLGFSPDDNDRNGITVYGFFNAFSLPLHRYFATDSSSIAVRSAFVAMLGRVFEGLGDSPESAALNARHVLAFETALRRADPAANGMQSRMATLAELRSGSPVFDWQAFARELGKPDLRSITLQPPTVVRSLDSLATAVSLDQWKAYLRWRLVFSIVPDLDRFQGAVSTFMLASSGRQRSPTRAEQCEQLTTSQLGSAVGSAYVRRTFAPQSRSAARTMIEEMRTVLRERIAALEWLGPESRTRALAKLNAMALWIGYPERMDELQGLELHDGNATANQLAARLYATDRALALVGTPVDRERWGDQHVYVADGTYYAQNALLITAAQLQPPFFDVRAEPAANYGRIGQVMGHELTHAFDSNGRLRNEFGRLDDWWTPNAVREFTRRADLIVQQYDQYNIVDSLRQNGRATLSENISDIGGITLAWYAFQRATQRRPREVIDGFTPEQRFFIAYAQSINTEVWRPELLQTQTQIDLYSHAAPKWRVNGPLSHLTAFAAAFGCKEGDPMVRSDALRWTVW